MDSIYWVVLAGLAILAAADLFVGVSNDAVNFLNSAVGCRIAPFKIVVAVAGLGVLLGASFSGGMMEIARKGIFNPAFFSFSDVISVYVAVMVTDILLLNAFNRLGLPTSTTVSIVFELLGAAAGIGLNRLLASGASVADIADVINSSRALAMISAILVSVVVAFVAGAVTQWIARVIFTFRYERIFSKLGGLYGGFAISMIFYFLVMKGAKSASFMTPELLGFFRTNSLEIVLCTFIASSVVLQFLQTALKVNIFRIIILAGTFSLAFAFAGNDLVNFVGVPIAAFDAAKLFMASGLTDPSALMMDGLAKSIPAPTGILLASGLVMVATLFFSRSARRVIETSVSLSSSASGDKEQFGATPPGRMIVKGAMQAGAVIGAFIPGSVRSALDRRFEPKTLEKGEEPLSFDAVRASLNLIVAAILIAFATSLKLPLSTTYVTFMVAMGSSFADRAWDRETAVYRVSGVITVISGWFLTAFSAFTAAAVVGIAVIYGGTVASVVLIALALAILVRTNLASRREAAADRELRDFNRESIRQELERDIPKQFDCATELFGALVSAVTSDDEKALKAVLAETEDRFEDVTVRRSRYYRMAKRGGKADADAKHFYYRSYTAMREADRVLMRLASLARTHVANRHRGFTPELSSTLFAVSRAADGMRKDVETFCRAGGSLAPLLERARAIDEMIDRAQEPVLTDVGRLGLSLHGAELYLMHLQCIRELMNRYKIVVSLLWNLNRNCRAEAHEKLKAAESSEVRNEKGEAFQTA